MKTRHCRYVGLLLGSFAVACDSDETAPQKPTEGQTAGGSNATGGAVSAGGVFAVGGSTSATGGVLGSGGALSTGGGTETTGGIGDAGTTSGGQSTGGISAGGVGSGGVNRGGTATATGGANRGGNATATGGVNAGGVNTGGTATTGGSVTAGGRTNTGGASGVAGQGVGGVAGAAGSGSTTVIRVQVNYNASAKQYQLGFAVREQSGTPALLKRATKVDTLGSFVGTVVEPSSNTVLYQQTIGTGYYYRELTRALTFRFPSRATPFVFKMKAENASSGTYEEVISTTIDPATLKDVASVAVETKLIKQATVTPKLIMPIYAEGYLAARKSAFYQDAQTAADTLKSYGFPAFDRFEMIAVWAPSNKTLGSPGTLGVVPTQDTFLGLSFPVWSDIDGPDVIIYPTDENKTRNGFAQVPYDYPLVIVDDSGYWGVGNYNMYTAIPAHNSYFKSLLVHEMGHFFGLNEEYNDQITELAFAPAMAEPWSQNLTFQTQRALIKWGDLIETSVTIPTPVSVWNSGKKIGAYKGGYPNDSRSLIPVPVGVCQMSTGSAFCAVCRRAIETKAAFDAE